MTKLRAVVYVMLFVGGILSGAAGSVQQQDRKSLRATHRVEPIYPEEARRAKVQGSVVLDVTVEESGEVSMATVVKGHQLLQLAAVKAAKQWRFSNPTGAPVTIQLTFTFTLPSSTRNRDEQPRAEQKSLKTIQRVDPVYPEEAKGKGIQGEVTVEIKVSTDGKVIDARATNGNDLLRQAAVDAAKQFRFENGSGSTVAATLTFNFVLGNKK
ncbi:MAG TPA: energy transducer TonB [Blastocatellia bacterium]|nr:energy transducer TonB [Blastocatellia bacterium]